MWAHLREGAFGSLRSRFFSRVVIVFAPGANPAKCLVHTQHVQPLCKTPPSQTRDAFSSLIVLQWIEHASGNLACMQRLLSYMAGVLIFSYLAT